MQPVDTFAPFMFANFVLVSLARLVVLVEAGMLAVEQGVGQGVTRVDGVVHGPRWTVVTVGGGWMGQGVKMCLLVSFD